MPGRRRAAPVSNEVSLQPIQPAEWWHIKHGDSANSTTVPSQSTQFNLLSMYLVVGMQQFSNTNPPQLNNEKPFLRLCILAKAQIAKIWN